MHTPDDPALRDFRVSPHFTLDEVERSDTAARLKLDNRLPSTLLGNLQRTAEMLEAARALLGVPLRVTSWYRCPKLNAAVGGSGTSAHMQALAVDFKPVGLALEEAFERIAAAVNMIHFDQLIIERTRDGAAWIHLGLRDVKAGPGRRQVLRASGAKLGGKMIYRPHQRAAES